MMMWPGLPRCSSDSRSRALLVVGHPILIVLWFGNSLFSSKNFPFESIRRTISHLCCLVGGDACSGGCCCLRGGLRSICGSGGCCRSGEATSVLVRCGLWLVSTCSCSLRLLMVTSLSLSFSDIEEISFLL